MSARTSLHPPVRLGLRDARPSAACGRLVFERFGVLAFGDVVLAGERRYVRAKKMSSPEDLVGLSRDVGLLLFDMLSRASPDGTVRPVGPAERRALLVLRAELERRLPEPLAADFARAPVAADFARAAKVRLTEPLANPGVSVPRKVVYVDVDDTLVRSFGSKRMPMPTVVQRVRELHDAGLELYCWSSGGKEYAHRSAVELGIAECFTGFLSKPNLMIDDQAPADWRTMRCLHPNEAVSMSVEELTALARNAAGQ